MHGAGKFAFSTDTLSTRSGNETVDFKKQRSGNGAELESQECCSYTVIQRPVDATKLEEVREPLGPDLTQQKSPGSGSRTPPRCVTYPESFVQELEHFP